MKILSVDLREAAHLGLKPKTMSRLGKLVVLAGPNGAGKSRVLKFVRDSLGNPVDIPALVASLPPPLPPPYAEALRVRQAFELDGALRNGAVVDYFPNAPALHDYREQSLANLARSATQARTPGTVHLRESVLPYIAEVFRRAFSLTHQDFPGEGHERVAAVALRDGLVALIEQFLGTRPAIDQDQHPTLFGKPIIDARLSPGQLLLLQLAVLLHAQGAQLNGQVLLIDEPDSHLHPAALIEAIDRLQKLDGVGQIWIATHSVPLLAHVPQDSIWYVKDGEVFWAGRETELVLEGLLGGPHGREKLEEFLRLPAQFASNRFAAECLSPPQVVSTGVEDPQLQQVRACLGRTEIQGRPRRILDYGAGHGRLLSALKEGWSEASEFSDAIDYLAFDPWPSDELKKMLGDAYPNDAAKRVFARAGELAALDYQSVDTVVMCNVLHEIEPKEWQKLFGDKGCLTRLLRKDGHILILEDMEIPHGEKAHKSGFLLLDSTLLHSLLKRVEKDPPIATVAFKEGRLLAHVVPAEILGRCDGESTRAALTNLKNDALERVRQIRSGPTLSRSGHLHALWTQLFANAELALEELGRN